MDNDQTPPGCWYVTKRGLRNLGRCAHDYILAPTLIYLPSFAIFSGALYGIQRWVSPAPAGINFLIVGSGFGHAAIDLALKKSFRYSNYPHINALQPEYNVEDFRLTQSLLAPKSRFRTKTVVVTNEYGNAGIQENPRNLPPVITSPYFSRLLIPTLVYRLPAICFLIYYVAGDTIMIFTSDDPESFLVNGSDFNYSGNQTAALDYTSNINRNLFLVRVLADVLAGLTIGGLSNLLYKFSARKFYKRKGALTIVNNEPSRCNLSAYTQSITSLNNLSDSVARTASLAPQALYNHAGGFDLVLKSMLGFGYSLSVAILVARTVEGAVFVGGWASQGALHSAGNLFIVGADRAIYFIKKSGVYCISSTGNCLLSIGRRMARVGNENPPERLQTPPPTPPVRLIKIASLNSLADEPIATPPPIITQSQLKQRASTLTGTQVITNPSAASTGQPLTCKDLARARNLLSDLVKDQPGESAVLTGGMFLLEQLHRQQAIRQGSFNPARECIEDTALVMENPSLSSSTISRQSSTNSFDSDDWV